MKSFYQSWRVSLKILPWMLIPLPGIIVAQEPRRNAEVTVERGFGMGPRVSDEQVARAVEATPPIPVGPIEPTWESLEQNYRVPEWFRDGKFGIFLHWGLYSIPAYHNEWYQKYMYGNRGIREWHIENFGPLDEYGYIRFAEQFATNFNADDWAELFKEAGATYVVPTAEHHDWFSLWTAK